MALLGIIVVGLLVYLGGVVYALKKDEFWGIWARWKGRKMAPGVPRIGDLPVDFTLRDLNGNEVTLSKVVKEHKVVIIDFFATWCPPCRTGVGYLHKLQRAYGDLGLKVLIIDIGKDAYAVKSFFLAGRYSLTILLDENEDVAGMYGVAGIPRTIFITKKGIVEDHVGLMRYSVLESTLRQYL